MCYAGTHIGTRKRDFEKIDARNEEESTAASGAQDFPLRLLEEAEARLDHAKVKIRKFLHVAAFRSIFFACTHTDKESGALAWSVLLLCFSFLASGFVLISSYFRTLCPINALAY